MATSPRTHFPYPNESSTPWGAVFEAMVNAVDASLYATREDRNIVIMGGGTMSFVAGSGVLTWSAPIQLLAAPSGFLWTIPAGSVTLADGQLFYITATRAPQNNVTCAPVVASIVPNEPNGDNQLLIGLRKGSVVHFREGFVLQDGQSTNVFDTNNAGGSGPVFHSQVFNAAGPFTWTAPADLIGATIFVEGCGGGGGGAGGAYYNTAGSAAGPSGGGGGGGAITVGRYYSVVANTLYNGNVGAGGGGGTAGNSGSINGGAGGDGSDSNFDNLVFYGAGGGGRGRSDLTTTNTSVPFAGQGGTPTRVQNTDLPYNQDSLFVWSGMQPHGGEISNFIMAAVAAASPGNGGCGGAYNSALSAQGGTLAPGASYPAGGGTARASSPGSGSAPGGGGGVSNNRYVSVSATAGDGGSSGNPGGPGGNATGPGCGGGGGGSGNASGRDGGAGGNGGAGFVAVYWWAAT